MPAAPASADPVDLLIVGAGINGAGIARDAAGRGLSVVLCDKGDIGGATSSASSKLIHGGLRYLEHYAFRLVAESLAEREVLLRIAPHLARPLRFVLPHSSRLRPRWMIAAGLMLYDTLAGLRVRRTLPRARAVELGGSPYGAPLQSQYRRGFVYSDVATDDARLTLANARSAADLGAFVLPRTRLVGAVRSPGAWLATLEDEAGRRTVRARALVNAAGPWVTRVLEGLPAAAVRQPVRLVRGSHIVVPRLYEGDHAYTLQNDDGRVCFLIPYQGRFTLVGTTEVDARDPDEPPAVGAAEVEYLCRCANGYLRRALSPEDAIWSFAGVRPLLDDGRADATALPREYRLGVDAGEDGRLPLLTVFGGKLTTYRSLAEKALERLSPWLPGLPRPWTADRPLPGGDQGGLDWTAFVGDLQLRHAALPADWLAALAARHGSLADAVLDGVRGPDDLGRDFGGGLFEREVLYCLHHEWALTADDLLWRRTKAGLFMSRAERSTFAEWFMSHARRPAADRDRKGTDHAVRASQQGS